MNLLKSRHQSCRGSAVSKRGKFKNLGGTDPDPWFRNKCESLSSSGFRALIWWPKLVKDYSWKKNLNFCNQKLQFMKDHPSHRRSLQPPKEKMQLFKTSNFFTFCFFSFCGSFRPPGSGPESAFLMRIRTDRPKSMRILFHNTES